MKIPIIQKRHIPTRIHRNLYYDIYEKNTRAALTIIALFAWLLIIALFSFRVVPTSLDDHNYIDHFNNELSRNLSSSEGLLSYTYKHIIEEPLWAVYTKVLGTFFSPENSIRITIGLSLSLLAASAFLCGRPLLFLIIYASVPPLLFNLDYLQLRQGLAVSVFTLAYQLSSRMKASASLAFLFHSSFLILIASAFLAGIKKRRHLLIIGTLCAASIYLIKTNASIPELMGRRSSYLDNDTYYNINFWITNIFIMVAFFLLGQHYTHLNSLTKKVPRSLNAASLNIGLALMVGALIAPIAGRLIINSNVLAIQAISDKEAKATPHLCLFILPWVAFHLYSLSIKIPENSDFFQSFQSLLM